MNILGMQGAPGQQAIASGVRVVIVEPNADVRVRLKAAIENAHTFVLVGAVDSWDKGAGLIETFVPELLIVRDTEVPSDVLRRLTSSAFPVVLPLTESEHNCSAKSAMETLSIPIHDRALTLVLERMLTEIYTRKAGELAQLVDCYLKGASDTRKYLARLKVDYQGQPTELATDEVFSISADGNYVRVQTPWKTYEMRETMTGLSEKLDPRSFLRVHRSFIVNLRYVYDVVDKAGACSMLLLSDGTEIPIGPNYREEISGTVNRKLRLTA